MLNATCIFCKIISGSLKSNLIKENAWVMAIEDISPKAPIHYLILPKKHIESFAHIEETDIEYCWAIIKMARDLGNAVSSKAFNLISNNGSSAGQSVLHLHLHFLAGKNLYQSGFKL